jgi:murein DD-endopeptidase MepM/ murein hydrolase activator NlpD
MLKDKKLNLLLISFYMIAFFILGYTLLTSSPAINKPDEVQKILKTVKKTDAFGLSTDSFYVKTGKIKANETISAIFSREGVPEATTYILQKSFKDIFDFRKVISGKNYRTYNSRDSLNSLKYFVYEKNPVNFVVIDLNDTINVYEGSREVTRKRREVSGIIRYSLYTALERNEADPELFVKLSEIFAWQIDFYHIQKGDNFKVIYDEESVGSKVIGIGKIVGAYFNHYGEDFYAIDFNIDGRDEYFDENGKSLRKAFLKAPLRYSRISSHFSRRRFHPILKRYKAHLGTDYAAPRGTPIRSVGDGVVIAASYTSGNGRYVKIRHNSVYTTQYLHMSKFAKGIRSGTPVKQGQIIGYVGSTGLATGPHLCYRFWKNGVQVDPLKQKLPPSKPIDEKYRDEFSKLSSRIKTELDKIQYHDSGSTSIASGI